MRKNIFLATLLAVGMTACTSDYTDWAEPQHSDPEVAEVLTLKVSDVPVINYNLDGVPDSVQVFVPELMSSAGASAQYCVELCNDPQEMPTAEAGDATTVLNADINGKVCSEELLAVVYDYFGRRPDERVMTARVVAYVSKNGITLKEVSNDIKVKVVPEAPVIQSAYYLVGDMVGWDASSMVKFNHSGKDVYEDSEFSITFTTDGENKYWKIIPQGNVDGGDIWADGVLGVAVDGDDSMEGQLVSTNPGAGKIAQPGMYKLTINMMSYTYSITKLEFPEYIYFIGATDGWANAEQKLACPAFDGKYTGYIYCADPNGWGNQFKFQKTPGDWGTEINSGHFTSFEGAATDAGGNIGVSGGENVYYFEVDLAAGSIKATEITNMNLVGDFNGWNAADDAQRMTWDAANYCYTITGAGVSANGWKFTANNDWGINLGGDALTNLVANGSNLSAVGGTIKLYPTRRGNDNIYCIVE